MAGGNRRGKALSGADYARLAAFRFALRRFLHFSESAATHAGLTGQQYQAMLAVRARAERAAMTINDLAGELLIRHHSAVGLVDRLVAQGLMARERASEDRRKVRLRLSAKGEMLLARLAAIHRQKLQRVGPQIHAILAEIGAWRRRR